MSDKMEIPDFSNYPALNNYMHKKDKYILDEHHNVIPADLIEWGLFFEKTKERIVKQQTVNSYIVSTVFLGLDHRFCFDKDESYKPLIFETMVFEKELNEIYCDRYSTWKEAEEGHQKAIEWVKNGCKDEDNE